MFKINSFEFADINECLSSPCEHTCINVQGSYKCSCYEGFKKINTDPKSKQCTSKLTIRM